jgi:hypothetical protein
VKKLTKEEIKSPDSFLKSMRELYKKIMIYRRQLLIGVTVLALVAAASLGWKSFQASQEEKAQVAYYKALKVYENQREKFEPIPSLEDPTKKKLENPAISKKEAEKATGDPQKDYGAAIGELQAVITTYPNSQAAILAAMTLSQIYQKVEHWGEAVGALEQIQDLKSKKGVVAYLALMTLGNNYANKGDCPSAIQVWESLASLSHAKYFEDEALLRQGLCYQKVGQLDKARDLYKRVQTASGDKPVGQSANHYLRLLDLSKQ